MSGNLSKNFKYFLNYCNIMQILLTVNLIDDFTLINHRLELLKMKVWREKDGERRKEGKDEEKKGRKR